MNNNTGHGHVWDRPDGVKMRCGGPAICSDCAKDLSAMQSNLKPSEKSDLKPIECEWKQVGHYLELQKGMHAALLRGSNWSVVKVDATDENFVVCVWRQEKSHTVARLKAELWMEEHLTNK